jgi:(E)-4-hydroxy-3-methylbut-2-enyl-diphosphate synthase
MDKIKRRKTKIIKIGDVLIGGDHPVAIQSMTKVKTSHVEDTVRQIKELELAGCEIVRLAIKDSADAKAIKTIKQKTRIPIVGDIHFDYRLALEAIDNGIDKIRLNPGNIYNKEEIRQVACAAKLSRIPIRVGLNSGSLKKSKGKNGFAKNTADAMVNDALEYIKILEGVGFYDIVVSLKASNIFDTIEAYRKMAGFCRYPMHLGVTATGLPLEGAIKSSIAVGALLLQGIGDTIRVSLTDNPAQEIKAAKYILEALSLRSFGPEIISCPTCGRCEVNLIKIVKDLEHSLAGTQGNRLSGARGTPAERRIDKPVKIAVMGCVVNGPGEAKDADIGVAFGKKEGLLFKKGKAIRKISFENCIDVLLKELKSV